LRAALPLRSADAVGLEGVPAALARHGGDRRRRAAARRLDAAIVHDPEKWEPVFGKDHAQTIEGRARRAPAERKRDAIGSSREGGIPEGVRAGLRAVAALLLQAEGDDQLSLREEPDLPALSRRARAAPLSQRRRALHRLQAVRGDLPGPGDHY